MRKKRIAVIGGGASGCLAAIAAARAGGEVVIFEKNEKLAKKIYATGNGRCNLTNLRLGRDCYRTQGGEAGLSRIMAWIDRFSQKDLIGFFAEEDVPVHDRDGYVYPRTDQAETVARALENCIRTEKITVYTCCRVLEITAHETHHFTVVFENLSKSAGSSREPFSKSRGAKESSSAKTGRPHSRGAAEPPRTEVREKRKSSNGEFAEKRITINGSTKNSTVVKSTYIKSAAEKSAAVKRTDITNVAISSDAIEFDAVILCTGGMAGPSFGCGGDGYGFAAKLGHSVIRPLPALTQLVCGDRELRRAAGVRCQAGIRLEPGGDFEEGELQITDYGISGIPVFQLSSRAARLLDGGGDVRAAIDFLPEFSEADYLREMRRRLLKSRDRTLGDLLLGLAHKKVIDCVLERKGLQAEMKAKRLSDGELDEILRLFRRFAVKVVSVKPFENAQTTCGGIPLSEVDDDLQSRICPGLFFAGELLDVDGRCGGYNLQWAMTTGVLAGRGAFGRLTV